MVLSTAAAWSDVVSIAVSTVLAFAFGYGLTMLPLVRSGLALSTAIGTALASDTVSIVIMELIDNAAMIFVPGALDAGLGDVLFWGTLLGGLAIAYPVAFGVNLYLIRNGAVRAHAHGSE